MVEPIRGKILVLDDDPTFRGLVRQILESRGFSVDESSSPGEATALFSARDTVLAIVDYRLPQMDGMSWITRLRESGRNTPIIFCSAVPCDMTTFNWLRNILKVALILQKPIIPESFVEQVESLLPGYEKNYVQEGVGASAEVIGYDESSASEEMLTELKKLKQKLELEKAIRDAKNEYLQVLDGHWRTLTELIDVHNNDKKRFDVLIESRHIAHRIRGTAGSVGLPVVSEVAGRLEDLLLGLDGQEDTQQEVIWSELIRVLAQGHEVISQSFKEIDRDGTTTSSSDNPAVLIVSGAEDVVRAARAAKPKQLAQIDMTDSPAGVGAYLARQRVDGMFLEMTTDRDTSFQRAADIRQMPGNGALPLGFFTTPHAPLSEVEQIYIGASVVLTHPVSADSLENGLQVLLNVAHPTEPRVLAVDDDEVLCRFVSNVLRTERIDTRTCTNPLTALELIDEYQPDLILLDVMMPALTGFEVCRRIRENNDWQGIPVVFLTSKTSAEARSAAFAVGANDFVTKPVLATELINRVTYQLNESLTKRHARARDPETGVMNGDAIMEQANIMLARHQNSGETMALGLLTVDDYDHLTLVQGQYAARQVAAALGLLLQQRFRGQDLRGRWSDQGYVLAVEGCDSDMLRGALAMLQEDFAKMSFAGGAFKFTPTFSAGIADSHDGGERLEELVKSAHHRMKQAIRDRTGAIGATG